MRSSADSSPLSDESARAIARLIWAGESAAAEGQLSSASQGSVRTSLLMAQAAWMQAVLTGDKPLAVVAVGRLDACADACEKADAMGKAEAPPFDIFVVLLLIGFGASVLYAVKYAIQKDGALSGDVRQRMLGEQKVVGPGKQNKSALGEKKRSAKKAS